MQFVPLARIAYTAAAAANVPTAHCNKSRDAIDVRETCVVWSTQRYSVLGTLMLQISSIHITRDKRKYRPITTNIAVASCDNA